MKRLISIQKTVFIPLLGAVAVFATSICFSADNPLPPDGEPLPTKRNLNDSLYGCKGRDSVFVEDIPMSITQVCAEQLNYKVLPRPGGNVCGRKGRKAWQSCMEGKLKKCVEMSNLQERRVPNNYCKDFKP